MSIAERQDGERGLRLLRASSAANQGAARVEAFRGLVSLGLVAVAVGFAVAGKPQPLLALIGFGWTLLSNLVVVPFSKKLSLEAATVQEQFDTYVFGLRWNAGRVTKLSPERIHELEERHRGGDDGIRGWYPGTDQVKPPFNILICQRANMMYDIGLRELWARIVETALTVWLVTGIVVGIIAGMTVWSLLLVWYIPSLAAIVLGFEIIKAQRHIVGERKIALATVNAELDHLHDEDGAPAGLVDKCRDVQDVIFETRNQVSRVPGKLYKWKRSKNEAKMKAAAEELKRPPEEGDGPKDAVEGE